MNEIKDEDLAQIVEIISTTALGLPVGPGLQVDMSNDIFMTAGIHVSGAWQGMVRLRASKSFLKFAAARMFAIRQDEVHEQHCVDTLEELTNMTAGLVKSLLPETSDLAIPHSLSADQYAANDPLWHYFSCGEYPLAVAVESHNGENVQAA